MSQVTAQAGQVQKKTESARQAEHKLARQDERGLAQVVVPQVAYRRMQGNGGGLRPADLLALQHTMGNRQVQRIVGYRLSDEYPRIQREIEENEEERLIQQNIPREFLQKTDLTVLLEQDLHHRYDLISSTISLIGKSTSKTAPLQDLAGQIGVELARRRVLAEGRTFPPEAIERMKRYFVTNATSVQPARCIVTLRNGLKELLGGPEPKGTTIQETMALLQATGEASAAQRIEFRSADGQLTSGLQRPAILDQSVWDTIINMAGEEPGWLVFGMSLMNGCHSVTLTLDNNNPAEPRIYWSDQIPSRGGWQEFNRESLDAKVTSWSQYAWDHHPDPCRKPITGKPKTRVTLWRIRQSKHLLVQP